MSSYNETQKPPQHWHEFDGIPLKINDVHGRELMVGDKVKVTEYKCHEGIAEIRFGIASAADGCCCTMDMVGPYLDFGSEQHHIDPEYTFELVSGSASKFLSLMQKIHKDEKVRQSNRFSYEIFEERQKLGLPGHPKDRSGDGK